STIVPLFLTWAIMGLWHGANWTFVFWGIYHASLVLIHRLITPFTSKLPHAVSSLGGWAITLPFIMLSWIPFRADDMHMVGGMFQKLVQPAQYAFLGMRENIYIVAALLMALVLIAYLFETYIWKYVSRNIYTRFVFETVGYTFAFLIVIIFLRPVSQFIYFQF
ncbi:MAG: MBOAT family protein, partial [Gemmatimonadaceae bacterium]|nr:MBOAT family protein [Chitinophagaceae bacterium]